MVQLMPMPPPSSFASLKSRMDFLFDVNLKEAIKRVFYDQMISPLTSLIQFTISTNYRESSNNYSVTIPLKTEVKQ